MIRPRESIKEEDVYRSPKGGPFYCVRRGHGGGMGPTYVWQVCGLLDDEREVTVSSDWPFDLATSRCDELNEVVAHWAKGGGHD